MGKMQGLLRKLFPFERDTKSWEKAKNDGLAAKDEGQVEYPDELYLYPELQSRSTYSDAFQLVIVPQETKEKCLALDDVSHPKQVTIYKKVRTTWIVRNSEVVEVPEPKKEKN